MSEPKTNNPKFIVHIPDCECERYTEVIYGCQHLLLAEKEALSQAVDAYAAELKQKLHKRAESGYSGWDSKSFGAEVIRGLLEHLEKGTVDFVDVAAFAMFAWNLPRVLVKTSEWVWTETRENA